MQTGEAEMWERSLGRRLFGRREFNKEENVITVVEIMKRNQINVPGG